MSPVLSVRCLGVLATLSTHESGEHWTLMVCPMAHDSASLWSSLRTGPVCTGRVWCEAAERPVWLVQVRVRVSHWR